MHRFYPLLRVFGALLIGFSVCLAVPMALSWLVEDGAHSVFDDAFVATLACGLALFLGLFRESRELKVRDGFLLVVLVWTVLPLFACLPFVLYLDVSSTDAYFEAASGLTATGATVLSGLDAMPLSINFWRTFMHWIGGIGVVVLAVAILPLLGIGGRQMFKAETPGPMKDSNLTPRMAETAKGLWVVYGVVTVLCILSLRWAGMSWFDAVMHSFTTMGLGGFSSHDASFGHWDSPLIEGITVVFMLIAGMNFATLFLAVRGRSLQPYLLDPEARYFIGVTLASVFGIALYLHWQETYPAFLTALRHSLFNVVSIATTTGLASVDYNLWPMFAPLWMLFLCSFATSAGSTGGGIKMMRAIILYKQVYRELLRAMHPNAIWPIRVGGGQVEQNILTAVLAFGFAYMCFLVALTLLMVFSGLDILTAFSAVVATVNNTGPGLNQVGPSTTFEVLTDFQTWVCSFAMLLGRLEIFTLLVVLTPAFWRR